MLEARKVVGVSRTTLREFNVAVAGLYAALVCCGEVVVSGAAFRAACRLSDALHSEAHAAARAAAEESLYWLSLLAACAPHSQRPRCREAAAVAEELLLQLDSTQCSSSG